MFKKYKITVIFWYLHKKSGYRMLPDFGTGLVAWTHVPRWLNRVWVVNKSNLCAHWTWHRYKRKEWFCNILLLLFIIKNGPNPATFCLFSLFSHDKFSINTLNDKSIDGVLGTRTRGGRMGGTYESTELWRHPNILYWP